MNKRHLILRDYQEPAADYIMTSDRCVLAISPNGGKTEISIEVISRYLKLNPTARVLILPHSTNVLLDNYWDRLDEINVDFTYSKTFEKNASVHICLPNNERHIKGSYDFLIVDEAHENYLADRVQRILTKTNPTKQLLLTGTPSKFISEGGYDIYAIAANEISDKWFAKLNIELVASDYNWINSYNSDNEVVNTFDFTSDDTKKTLESVLGKLIQRIKTGFSAEQFNHPSFVTKLKSWAFTYNTIGKTMITCKRVEQADLVHKILIENGVNSIISHNECDPDSNNIVKFKNNEYNVLVAVNRGRLGYNDADLINIIDLSGTHNPDIIYQMFCRVIRGTPEDEKFYLKVTPKESYNMALTHISVCGALMLTDKKYLLEYNGRNFNNMTFPILRRQLMELDNDEDDNGGLTITRRRNNIQTLLLPEFTHDIIDVFKNIIHDLNNPVSIYKSTTFGHVKYTLGFRNVRPPMTFEDLLESARGNV